MYLDNVHPSCVRDEKSTQIKRVNQSKLLVREKVSINDKCFVEYVEEEADRRCSSAVIFLANFLGCFVVYASFQQPVDA